METTDNFINQGLSWASSISQNTAIVVGIFSLITLGWEYGKRMMYNSALDFGPLVKWGALTILLAAYTPLMENFIKIGQLIDVNAKTTANIGDGFMDYNERLSNLMVAKIEDFESTIATNDGVEVKSKTIESNILMATATLFVFNISTDAFFTLRNIILGILLALGPVSIIFSFFRLFDRSFVTWFRFLFIFLLWKTVFYIGFSFIIRIPLDSDPDWTTIATYMFVEISFFIISFKIAGWLISSTSTGFFSSNYSFLKK